MKVIIAGTRSIEAANMLLPLAVIDSGLDIKEVVSGTAIGADQWGEQWAASAGLPVSKFPADWGLYGRAAGPIRNKEMAKYADALIAIWDGKSRGTRSMINEMGRLDKPIYVKRFKWVGEGPENLMPSPL